MTEAITQMRVEDAIANTNAFLGAERGVSIDGDFAADNVAERIKSVEDSAIDILTTFPNPQFGTQTLEGFYVPVSRYNANRFDEAVQSLPGYSVLLRSDTLDPGTSSFYPAVVSEDGLKTGDIRLHVLKQPFRQKIRYGASMVLSAAGQSETKGVGEHGRKSNDGVEAEHFATLLAAGSDADVRKDWLLGEHVNHKWRAQTGSSVTAEVSNRLFGADIPQETITITRKQVELGQAMLFWHRDMIDEKTGKPEAAIKKNALVVIQALGHEAMLQVTPENPRGTLEGRRQQDNVKELLAS